MKSKLLKKCIAGEIIEITSEVPASMGLYTPDNYRLHSLDAPGAIPYGTTKLVKNCTLRIPFDGDWYIVVDDDTPNMKPSYSKNKLVISDYNSTLNAEVIVHNADDTADLDDGDMADYWEEHMGEIQDGYICPSCHTEVDRDEIDGAHVELTYGSNKHLYIIPTCQSCNRSKDKKNFVVSSEKLVLAPKQRNKK